MLIARWLWARNTLPARLARMALIPPALMFRMIAAVRVRAYRCRILPSESAKVPTIAVGNLTVGGSGKTPIAAWIAAYYARSGLRPGIVLRGYGGDEGAVHRKLVSGAVVVENPDRLAGALDATSRGANVVVLDDAYQRLDINRDLNIAVVSAESRRAPRWTLPAGPWREAWRALRRADLILVTRKRASLSAALSVARQVTHEVGDKPVAIVRLGIIGFRSLKTGIRFEADMIDGATIVAAAGIADPDSFAAQCRAMGAIVRLLPWKDHHNPTDRELRDLGLAGSNADYIVITEKDAVKIGHRWPLFRQDLYVAELDLAWEQGGELVEAALNDAVADVDRLVCGALE